MSSARYTENKNPDFAMLNIYVDPTGVGHTAIGTDGKTIGFYPGSGGGKANMYSSPMSYQEMSSEEFLEEKYSSANIFFLKVSLNHKNATMAYLLTVKESIDKGAGPTYEVFGNNCTTVALSALNFGNIRVGNFVTPVSFNSSLKSQYGTMNSPVIGWLDRGNTIVPSSEPRKILGIGRDAFHN